MHARAQGRGCSFRRSLVEWILTESNRNSFRSAAFTRLGRSTKNEENAFNNNGRGISARVNWNRVCGRSAGGPHQGAQRESADAHWKRHQEWLADSQGSRASGEQGSQTQQGNPHRSKGEWGQPHQQRKGAGKPATEPAEQGHLQPEAR